MTPPQPARARSAPAPARLLAALESALDPSSLDPAVAPALWDRALGDPLREFARRPGKELRARLAEVAWSLAGGGGAVPEAIPLVVEGLHAGSLIVDDIQDDASERRGAPALHLLHGAPLAINSGNWLYFWAIAQLDDVDVDDRTRLAMHRATIDTLLSCHQGQALDLTVRATEIEQGRIAPVVAAITRGKTAALMGLGPRLAALAAGAEPAPVRLLGLLGEQLGTGLQMLDDVGGLGRARRAKGREDLRGARATWAWAWAAERLDDLGYVRLVHRARLAIVAPDDVELDAIADLLDAEVGELGRGRACAVTRAALAGTAEVLGDSAALAALAAEVARLEVSHV